MNRTLLSVLIAVLTPFTMTSAQDDTYGSDPGTMVDLTVEITVDSVPDNALVPATDSMIFITLYKDGVTSHGPFVSSSRIYDRSEMSLTVDFDSLPAVRYSLGITFPMYDIKGDILSTFDLTSDSTISISVKPRTSYTILVSAYPTDYFLYFGYLTGTSQKEPAQYSFMGKPDEFVVPGGSFEFTVLSRKRWKLKLKLSNEVEEISAKINKIFRESTFRIENPFETESEPPFEWIMVEQLK